MNKSYSIIWSASRNTFVVASELARAGGRAQRCVRAVGLAAGLLLSGSACVNAAEVGPKSGGSINLQDGDTITLTSGGAGVSSTVVGGTGLQIDGNAQINITGDGGSAGIWLDNGVHNGLGIGTEISVKDAGEVGYNTFGLRVDRSNLNTTVQASALAVDVTGSRNAYGVYLTGKGNSVNLGENSSIIVESTTGTNDYVTRGVWLYGEDTAFRMDNGLIRASSMQGAISGVSGIWAESANEIIDLGNNTRIEVFGANAPAQGIWAGGSGASIVGHGIDININMAGYARAMGLQLAAGGVADFGKNSAISISGGTHEGTGIYLKPGASFTADGFDLSLSTDYRPMNPGDPSYVRGTGIHLDSGASVDLGSGSSILMRGFSQGEGIYLSSSSVGLKADRLTLDVSGNGVSGIFVRDGIVDLGTGSIVRVAGDEELRSSTAGITMVGGELKAENLTIKIMNTLGIWNSPMSTAKVSIGAGSVIDGRGDGTERFTRGIVHNGASNGKTFDFHGTESNRNTIYAMNAQGASSLMAGSVLNISNTDIIMSGRTSESSGLFAAGNNPNITEGVINAENVTIDVTASGSKGYGILTGRGGVVNLSGATTIVADNGMAIYNQYGSVFGSGVMNIFGTILNSNDKGKVDLAMEANSYFLGAADYSYNSGALNLSLAEQSQWIITDGPGVAGSGSRVSTLASAGKLVFAIDSQNGTYSRLNAGSLTLESSSEVNVDLGAAARGSTAGTPLITGGDAVLDGVLRISNVSDAFGLSALTSDADLPHLQVTLMDMDNAIVGNFARLATDPMTVPDYLAFSGRVNDADNTQYLLGGGLSWFVEPSSTMTVTPAHGNFTLDANKSFEVTTALVDVTPEPTTGWDGKSLTKKGDGRLILSTDNTYSGMTKVQNGMLWLTHSGTIGASGSQQAVNVDLAGTLGGSGVVNGLVDNLGLVSFDTLLTVNGSVTNAGNIASSNATPSGQLLVNGDYVGNNGMLTLNTQLGGDSSLTDRLVVNGNTSGMTTLMVNNVGGAGAETTNGIEVISVSGRSDGAFTQGNRLLAGAYEYRLYKDGGNWYLRTLSDDPSPEPGVDPDNPQYRPDIGAFIGNQAMVKNLQMQTLYDREGSQHQSKDGAMWMRFKAGMADSSAANGNVDIDNHYSQIQLGSDIAAWRSEEQSLNVGLMGSYVKANTNSTGNRGADGSRFSASGDVHGYNLGVYTTWFADVQTHQGLYVDSWYQYGMYDNMVNNAGLGSSSYDSTANAISLETGYRHDVEISEGRTLSLIPQAQVVWQNYKADAVYVNGVRADGQNGDGWSSRLGLRVAGKLDKDQNVIQPFLEANWLHSTDDVLVSFDGVRVKQDFSADRAELKMGIQANLGSQWSVAAQAVGQKGGHGYGDASFGLNVRYSW